MRVRQMTDCVEDGTSDKNGAGDQILELFRAYGRVRKSSRMVNRPRCRGRTRSRRMRVKPQDGHWPSCAIFGVDTASLDNSKDNVARDTWEPSIRHPPPINVCVSVDSLN